MTRPVGAVRRVTRERQLAPRRATTLYSSVPRAHHGRPASAYSAVSLFAGCGGLDLGAERSGLVKTVWAIDNDPWAVKTYRNNLGPHIWDGDIRDVDFPDVPCDILLAGPPCQDFSSLWNHDGAKTDRGNLFREVARFLDQRQPKAFVIENVQGLLSANHGEAWLLVRHALRAPSQFLYDGTGPRYEVTAQLVDFADLGVPQNRPRLIVLGVRRDLGIRPPEIPLPMQGRHRTVGDALDAEPIPHDAPNHETGLDSEDVVERLKLIAPGLNYKSIPKDHPLFVKGLISHVYRRLDPGRPSYTIIAGGGGGTHGYHHVHPRRLSNRERARLQSFPDDFIFEGGEGRSAYPRVRRQIGNAVPPEGGRVIVKTLAEALREARVPGTSARAIAEARRSVSIP
jgi:DNA (cytosine-5)-methyltransferase 1